MSQTPQEAEQLVRDYSEMCNEQDESRIPALVSESFVVCKPALPEGEARGHDGLKEWMHQIRSGFPDLQVDVRDLLAGEETVMTEVTYTMTHDGEFGGIPPTEREVELPGMTKFRIEDGKPREQRDYYDQQDLFDRLGITDE